MSKLFLTESEAKLLDLSGPAQAIVGAGSAIREMQKIKPFNKKVTMVGATSLTPVEVLSDAEVGPGKIPVIRGWLAKTSAAGTWGNNAGTAFMQSNDGNRDLRTVAINGFATQTRLLNAVLGNGTSVAIGGDLADPAAGQGIRILADDNEAGANDIIWEIWGDIVDV